jgi:hypothetical protein
VKAVQDRIIRDVNELKPHGMNAIAIMSNDPADYPEDSFENMALVAKQLNYPFLTSGTKRRKSLKNMARCARPIFLVSIVNWNCNIADGWMHRGKKRRLPMCAAICLKPCCRSPKPDAVRRNQIPSIGCSIKWRYGVNVLEEVIAVVKKSRSKLSCRAICKWIVRSNRMAAFFTEADVAAQNALLHELQKIYPAATMGEEMTKQEQEAQWIKGKAGLWSIDPIDGTSNFLNGLPYFAISVALMEQGKECSGGDL